MEEGLSPKAQVSSFGLSHHGFCFQAGQHLAEAELGDKELQGFQIPSPPLTSETLCGKIGKPIKMKWDHIYVHT